MKEAKIHSVGYNFIMNFLLTASSFLFPLITFPYVSRVLQATAMGRVSFVASVANYFLMVASLGIPTYAIRACAQVRDDRKQLSKVAQEILIINLIATALVMVTYGVMIVTVPRFRSDTTLFLINGVQIILNAIGVNWLYQALEQYDYITVRSVIFKVVSVALMFWLVKSESDYVIYGAITVFAAAGANVLSLLRMWRYVDFKKEGKYEFRRHLKPIFVLFAQNAAVSVYTNLDIVMLGFIKGDYEVGLYSVAVKIKAVLLSLVTSLGNVLLPRMSYYAKSNDVEKFQSTAVMALNFTMLLSVPLSLFFVMYADDSILLLAGAGYVGAVLATQLLTVAVVPNGLTGVLGVQVLTAQGREKCVLYSVIGGAVIDFALNLVLIPKYGVTGAALATMIAELGVLAIQIFYTRGLLRRVLKSMRVWAYLLAAVAGAALSMTAGFLTVDSVVLRLLLHAALFGVGYGLVLLLLREPLLMKALERIFKKNKAESKEKTQ